MHTIVEYPSSQHQAEGLADEVAAQLAQSLADKGRATLAVPGGTTPGAFLTALSKAEIDWAHVSVLLTDERFVAEQDARSNMRLLRETLARNAASAATFVSLYAPAEFPESVLGEIAQAVEAVLPIDVCVLGMGADMHIASLFPEGDRLSEALANDCASVLLPMRAKGAIEPRLTLTAPVLEAARHLHLLIRGAEKVEAISRATAEPSLENAPVKLLLERPNLTIHIADGELT
ncbi:6-phosphogluconolactonase [Shimia thalassica]|uniref:6-phosphogluconolactonase n=1 Tax=Shimia thalassica TaxID=1715693 RepID=UPI002733939E|nr:6-phosphogluconolactonase [Shimia thalassica]MDP2581926.1 6-phosphogluconolactonase [Shimia thalassica]